MSKQSPTPVQQTVIVQQAPSNGLGTAGFVVSLIGFLTCGLLCPLGLLFSLLGLLKPPRGMALAGSVIGGIGSAWLFFFGFAIVAGLMGLDKAAQEAGKDLKRQREQAQSRISSEPVATSSESTEEGQQQTAGTPESPIDPLGANPEVAPTENENSNQEVNVPSTTSARDNDDAFHTFKDNTGKFSVEAKFIKRALNKVTIEKRDGRQIEIDFDRLSEDDQKYVKKRGT